MAAEIASLAALRLPSDQDASGRTLGDEELALAARGDRSGTLTSTKGTHVPALRGRASPRCSACPHAVACASGTAAVHAAVAAIDPEPGDEIITTPITDMGALAPILYQGAIPVFADVDPRTCNVTRGDDRGAALRAHAGRSSSRTCSATRATWPRSSRSPPAPASR